jgi:hypothetical protein
MVAQPCQGASEVTATDGVSKALTLVAMVAANIASTLAAISATVNMADAGATLIASGVTYLKRTGLVAVVTVAVVVAKENRMGLEAVEVVMVADLAASKWIGLEAVEVVVAVGLAASKRIGLEAVEVVVVADLAASKWIGLEAVEVVMASATAAAGVAV